MSTAATATLLENNMFARFVVGKVVAHTLGASVSSYSVVSRAQQDGERPKQPPISSHMRRPYCDRC